MLEIIISENDENDGQPLNQCRQGVKLLSFGNPICWLGFPIGHQEKNQGFEKPKDYPFIQKA